MYQNPGAFLGMLSLHLNHWEKHHLLTLVVMDPGQMVQGITYQ